MEPTASQTHPAETSAEAAETLPRAGDVTSEREQGEGEAGVPAEEPRRFSILEMLEDDAVDGDGGGDADDEGTAASTAARKQRRSFKNPATVKGLQEANSRRSDDGDGDEVGAAGSGGADDQDAAAGTAEAEAEEVETAEAGTLETAGATEAEKTEAETGEAEVVEAGVARAEAAKAEPAEAGTEGTDTVEAGTVGPETEAAGAGEVGTARQESAAPETAGSGPEAAGAEQKPVADAGSDEHEPAGVEAASPEDNGHPVVDETAQAVVDDLLPEWIGSTEVPQEKGFLARLLDGLLGRGRESGEAPASDAGPDGELTDPAAAGDDVDAGPSPTEEPVAGAAPEADAPEPEARSPDSPELGTGDDLAVSRDDGPETVEAASADTPVETPADAPAETAAETVEGAGERPDDPARAVVRRMIQERDRELVGAKRDSARLYELAATVDDFVEEILAAARE